MNHIAIIDDSEMNLTLLSVLVTKLGHGEPMVFSNACEGLNWCRENRPALVIVDYMMPELDGISLISQFRRAEGCQDIPVLMITANDDKDVRYRALEAGATDFLNKPVDRIEFSARVRNMLKLAESHRVLSDHAKWLADEVARATEAIHDRERELLFRMSRAAEFRDPETGAHIQRMAHYSRLIAVNIGLSTEEQEVILRAAPMHDIGKIGVPDHILLKPGKLDADEWTLMKRHAEIGFELLKGSESVTLQMAAVIALSHHEWFDGSGYPLGVRGTEIPIAGRIAAVADVFDALTSERPYKRAWSLEDARDFLLQHSGTHFDPALVNAFLSSWPIVQEIHMKYRDEELCHSTGKKQGPSKH